MKNNYAYGSLAAFLPLEDARFPFEQEAVFGRAAPLEAEIGFGTGEYILRMASASPERDFIGFEQCATRILKTLRKLHDAKAGNVRVMRMDAVWAFRFLLRERSLQRVHCLFPCPWPKKRHAKHRLFSQEVLRLINSRLADGCGLHIVTDHKPYAAWIAERAGEAGFDLGQALIPAKFGTKFERKWAEAGQSGFYELNLTKVQHQGVPQGGEDMKAYFLDQVDLEKICLENVWGPVTIKFGEMLYDPRAQKAMVDAVVSEDGRAQHVWVVVSRRQKGWCVCSAAGTAALPTQGVQRAVACVAEAAKASVTP